MYSYMYSSTHKHCRHYFHRLPGRHTFVCVCLCVFACMCVCVVVRGREKGSGGVGVTMIGIEKMWKSDRARARTSAQLRESTREREGTGLGI